MPDRFDTNNYPHQTHYLEYFDRSSAGTQKVTLSIEQSPMVILSYTATQYVQTTSAIFRKKFGVGSTAWRLLVVLFRHPNSSSNEIGQFVRTDKAAVSRTLNALMDQGYVCCTSDPNDERIKLWSLSESGQTLHDQMLETSATIYEHLLSGFTDTELDVLRTCLHTLSKKIAQLPKDIGD